MKRSGVRMWPPPRVDWGDLVVGTLITALAIGVLGVVAMGLREAFTKEPGVSWAVTGFVGFCFLFSYIVNVVTDEQRARERERTKRAREGRY